MRDPRQLSRRTVRKDKGMAKNRLQLLSEEPGSPGGLVACSVCLRVLRASRWVDAERVIRELRSFELEAPPRLEPALCTVCAESIFSRRSQAHEVVAA